MRKRQKKNSFLLQIEEENVQKGKNGSELGFSDFRERERVCLLSRFPDVQTVDPRRSKKQSRSTRRGLRVDTDLVEFQQLQEVEVFSYLCYSLPKSHFMDKDLLGPE